MASTLTAEDMEALRRSAAEARALVPARKLGRPSRAEEAITLGFRATIARMLSEQSPYIEPALHVVREQSPLMYLKMISELAEYAAPKLSRTEHIGEVGDGTLTVQILQITAPALPPEAVVSSPVIPEAPPPPPPLTVEVVIP